MGWAEFVLAEILTIAVVLAVVAYPVRREYARLAAEADHWRTLADEIAASRNIRLLPADDREET